MCLFSACALAASAKGRSTLASTTRPCGSPPNKRMTLHILELRSIAHSLVVCEHPKALHRKANGSVPISGRYALQRAAAQQGQARKLQSPPHRTCDSRNHR